MYNEEVAQKFHIWLADKLVASNARFKGNGSFIKSSLGCKLHLSYMRNDCLQQPDVYIDLIQCSEIGTGIGSKVMTMFCDGLDIFNLRCELMSFYVSPGMSQRRLDAFYRSFGFKAFSHPTFVRTPIDCVTWANVLTEIYEDPKYLKLVRRIPKETTPQ